jgi:glycosyltransferase involved in cell wall biosynthesis
VVAVTGWCYHPRHRLTRLELLLNGRPHAADLFGIRRDDLLEAHPAARDPRGLRQWGGFAGLVPVPGVDEPTEAELALRAELADGSRHTATLARVRVQPDRADDPPALYTPDRPRPSARVAVCLATYDPPPELFERQVRSLQAQTLTDWVGIVCDDHSRPERFARVRAVLGDDPRFRLYRQPANRGFYRNFEQCLALAPPGVEFVTLADQDDVWHPDKLAALSAGFGPRTSLVYSDMRIVDDRGTVLAPTYWTTRRNNHRDLAALLLANSITGAAAMFRRRLLDVILPFPDLAGAAYHDHWIACAALASGGVRYLDRPLYDYVQHGRNVIGHVAPPMVSAWARAGKWLRFLQPAKLRRNLRQLLEDGQWLYASDLLRVRQMAETIGLRCGRDLSAAKQRAVRRVAAMHASPAGWLWLFARPLRHPSGVSDTLGAEYFLLTALLWRAYARAARLKAAWRDWLRAPAAPESGRADARAA